MNKILYVCKQLINSELKEVFLTCYSKKDVDSKNKNFYDITNALKENGNNITSINLDSSFNKECDINGVDAVKKLSINLESINSKEDTIKIYNLPNIEYNEQYFTSDNNINNIILSVKYGSTSYKDLDSLKVFLKENGINVISVLANK